MSTPDPNRYAGPAEAALLREHTADDAVRVALDLRAAHAETALHDATEELHAAQEAFDSAKRIAGHVCELRDRPQSARAPRADYCITYDVCWTNFSS